MTPFYNRNGITIYWGDNLDVLPGLDTLFDGCVTDPPYGLTTGNSKGGFMGQKWDGAVPSVATWKAVIERLKPGAHNLSFGGTRTYHRMVVAIEDAGFEIRDMLGWLFGQGPGLGQNIGKAIDKAAGVEREVLFTDKNIARKDGRQGASLGRQQGQSGNITAPATPEAAEWDGWHTTLKPALNPICLARKPLSEPTVAANVLKHGAGGLNVGATRIGNEAIKTNAKKKGESFTSVGDGRGFNGCDENFHQGRYPSNLILDDSAAVAGLFPETTSGKALPHHIDRGRNTIYGEKKGGQMQESFGDSGSATRYFYQSKADKQDRYFHCAICQSAHPATARNGHRHGRDDWEHIASHPTVKPLDLMTYLCRFFLRPGAIILDPFMGTGTTLLAALNLGMEAVGIERDKKYCEIAVERLHQPPLFSLPMVEVEEAGVVQGELFE